MPYAKTNPIQVAYPGRYRNAAPKYNYYYNQKKLFSEEECKKILSFFEEEHPRAYAVTQTDLTVIPSGSLFTEDFLTWNEESNFIYERLQEWTTELQLDFKWIKPPAAEFRKYKVGDYFVKHDDNPWDHGDNPKRYFTITIQLDEDYEGGEFILDDDNVLKSGTGITSLWGIAVLHEVTKITKGERNVLTCFIDQGSGKVQLQKNLI